MLVIKRPWPSMIRTIWGDPSASRRATTRRSSAASCISPATARCATRTGYFTIMGRIDDVLNVSGHRLGTMEVESALVANPIVAEAAVVGRPDDLTGEAICAFVVLKRARPEGRGGGEAREGAARLGRQGDRADREAEGHPLRRQPAEDALGQDHAAAAALDRQGRDDHAGHVDARESRDPRAAQRRSTRPKRPVPKRQRWFSRDGMGGGGGAARHLLVEEARAASCAQRANVARSVAVADRRMNDIGSTLFALRLVKAVIEIALLALVGQGHRVGVDPRGGPAAGEQRLLSHVADDRDAHHAAVALGHAEVRRRPAHSVGSAGPARRGLGMGAARDPQRACGRQPDCGRVRATARSCRRLRFAAGAC